MKQFDTFNYGDFILEELGNSAYWDFCKARRKEEKKPENNVRTKLFWDFRYRMGSYKARKAGISRPSVMMKYKNDKFRLYGAPEGNKLFEHCKDILKGWKARSKAEMRSLMPEYRDWLKANRLQTKHNSFSSWLINVKHNTTQTGDRTNVRHSKG